MIPQSRIYFRELFKYVIPFNFYTTWHDCGAIEAANKKVTVYCYLLIGCLLAALPLPPHWLHYYINTIPRTEGKRFPYLKVAHTQKALFA